MQPIEFETKPFKGIIKIPELYEDWYDKPLKVVLMMPDNVKKDNDKAELLCFFNQFNADLTDYHFDRDEANER